MQERGCNFASALCAKQASVVMQSSRDESQVRQVQGTVSSTKLNYIYTSGWRWMGPAYQPHR